MDEKLMIDGCVNNDIRSQNQLYHKYYPILIKIIQKYTNQKDIIDEILNIGFLRIYKKIHTYNFQGSFEGWAKKIMLQAVFKHHRNNIRYKDKVILVDKEIGNEHNNTPLDTIYYKQILKLIYNLPKNHREVFNLYYTENLSHKEIGEKMNITAGTSKWYLSEGKKMLRKNINKLN